MFTRSRGKHPPPPGRALVLATLKPGGGGAVTVTPIVCDPLKFRKGDEFCFCLSSCSSSGRDLIKDGG